MLGAESLRTHATEIGIKFVTLFDVEGEGPVDQYLFHWLLQQVNLLNTYSVYSGFKCILTCVLFTSIMILF